MKDIIIPTGSLITRTIEPDRLIIHSPKRKKSGMIIFYQVFAILVMAFLVLAIVTTINEKPIAALFTIPFWPIPVFLFRLGKKAASLEQWLYITEEALLIKKKNAYYVKEWSIPLTGLKSISLKPVGLFDSIRNMSYYVRRRDPDNSEVLYPTIEYQEKGKKHLTFYENATAKEMEWIVADLQQLIPSDK